MLSLFLKNRYVATAVIGLVVSVICWVFMFLGLFQGLHNQFSNALYSIDSPSDKIVIVAIDDKSTTSPPTGFGRYSLWNRDRFSEMTEILAGESPKVIAFDILFHTNTTIIPQDKIDELKVQIASTAANKEKLDIYDTFVQRYGDALNNPIDERFAEQLAKLNNLVLATYPKIENAPLYKFRKNASLGVVTSNLDEEGTVRKNKIQFDVGNEILLDDMGVAVAKKYLDKEKIDIPVDQNGEMMVNFFGDPWSYKMISFVDVVNKNFEPGTFKDKIVLIGATSFKEIHDEVLTPRSNVQPMSGVEFWANEIQTILDGKFLHNQSKFSQVITIACISTGLAIILSYLGVMLSILVTLITIVVYIFAAHFFYSGGLIVNMVYPFIAIVLTYLGSWVYKYFIADRKKREMKNAFGHYVSKELVEQISNNPDLVKLGGEKKEVTVFFSDIQNSTTLSEQIAIEEWVKQINEYFTAMERIVMQSGGTLDKYEGDAIMAFWNAPLDQPDHVTRGYLAALTMIKVLNQLHAKWQQEGKPAINIRIGINTGPALVGNFGSENRLDYTVMGDTVNTASRFESSANKTYNTQICVGGITEQNKPAGMVLRELDRVLLPGKKEAVVIFELVCGANEYTPALEQVVMTYQKGLAAYRAKNWPEAITNFSALPNDKPSQVMLARCQVLQNGGVVEGLDVAQMVFQIAHK